MMKANAKLVGNMNFRQGTCELSLQCAINQPAGISKRETGTTYPSNFCIQISTRPLYIFYLFLFRFLKCVKLPNIYVMCVCVYRDNEDVNRTVVFSCKVKNGTLLRYENYLFEWCTNCILLTYNYTSLFLSVCNS